MDREQPLHEPTSLHEGGVGGVAHTMPPIPHFEPDLDTGWTARTMAGPLENALRNEGAPYPEFQSLVRSVRFVVGSKEAFSSRFNIPAEDVQRFENGDLHPSRFPEGSLRDAAGVLGPVDRWTKAIDHAKQPPSSAE